MFLRSTTSLDQVKHSTMEIHWHFSFGVPWKFAYFLYTCFSAASTFVRPICKIFPILNGTGIRVSCESIYYSELADLFEWSKLVPLSHFHALPDILRLGNCRVPGSGWDISRVVFSHSFSKITCSLSWYPELFHINMKPVTVKHVHMVSSNWCKSIFFHHQKISVTYLSSTSFLLTNSLVTLQP